MEQPIFEKFRSIIYRESGIVLPPEKLPLLSSRIQKRLSALGLENEGEYLKIIECDIDGSELTNLIDVVSTNVTHFYREEEHFAALRQIVTARVGKDRSTIKLWCAAASSGEEPYTLAFELSEALKAAQVDFKILATDICTRVLNHALRGSYESHAVNRIPPEIRNRYLKHDRSEELWQVAPEIMAKILFKKLNLVSFPYPLTGGLT